MSLIIPLLALAGQLLTPGRSEARDIDSLFDGFFREWIAMNPEDASQYYAHSTLCMGRCMDHLNPRNNFSIS